jgi:hypothetical protein
MDVLVDLDWKMYCLEHYLKVLLISPLIVHDTLLVIQYQPRTEPQHSSQYLIPLHPQFIHSYRTISSSFGLTFYLRGHFTLFLHQSIYHILTPLVEETLNDVLDVFEDTNPWTLVLAHATIGGLLTPLELIQTRLIAQSPQPGRAQYYGPFDGLFSLSKEKPLKESGWLRTVYQPYIILPTIVYHSLNALVRFGSKVVIENELGLDSSFDPFLYKLTQLVFLGVEAAIMTPLDMARKRLYVQRLDAKSVQYGKKEATGRFDCSVETFEGVYNGAMDVVAQIVTEEGSIEKQKPSKVSSEEWDSIYGGGSSAKKDQHWLKGVGSGVYSLYRGFWSKYTIMTIQFIAKEITNEENW